MTDHCIPTEAVDALEELEDYLDPSLAPQILDALAVAGVLRPRPWPPIPRPDDVVHQARWTMQREFDRAMWETGDRNEGLIAAAMALVAEGWTPPPSADLAERTERLTEGLNSGGTFYQGSLHDLRAVLRQPPMP